MASDWETGFELESVWHREEERYQLTLRNHGKVELRGFSLGISGPARVSVNADIVGGRFVRSLSNYCEIAAEPDAVLVPGGEWVIDIFKLDFPIRHWTDGATTGFVIDADGTTTVARTRSTRLAGSDDKRRRGTIVMPVPDEPPVPVSVIPWPEQVDVSGRRTPPLGLALLANDDQLRAVTDRFTALAQRLFPGDGMVRDVEQGGLPIELAFNDQLSREGYAVTFSTTGASVIGGSAEGLFYGLVTLGQIWRGARLHAQSFVFPTDGSIEDQPRMDWRGCMLDVARRFYSVEEVKQFIALLAWNKLNVFHFHLADDEAFRVEIEAYPELMQHAAFRGHGMAVPPLLGSGPERTGGYYSKRDIGEIVALAADFGVDVVPEFDIPGHCYAMVQALPQLRDPGETGHYYSIQSFPNNCLNPAVDAVYEVVETILDEMAALFPSAYFHVGADEVPADAWAGSPAANAMRDRLGVTGAAPLQAAFLKRIHAFLAAKGKITGAWEEAAHGDGVTPDKSYLVGWQNPEISRELAAQGYKVVVAPAPFYYLNMAHSVDWHECGAGWAGWSPRQRTYQFDPVAGWSDAEKAQLLGVQGCIWSEHMSDRGVFNRLIYPRISAIAETGWTQESKRDFTRWSALAGLMPTLYGIVEGA